MGYIPPPPRVLPPNATKEDKEKLYWEYRAELVAARGPKISKFEYILGFGTVGFGFAVIFYVILQIFFGLMAFFFS